MPRLYVAQAAVCTNRMGSYYTSCISVVRFVSVAGPNILSVHPHTCVHIRGEALRKVPSSELYIKSASRLQRDGEMGKITVSPKLLPAYALLPPQPRVRLYYRTIPCTKTKYIPHISFRLLTMYIKLCTPGAGGTWFACFK